MKNLFTLLAALIFTASISAQSATSEIIDLKATNAETEYNDLYGMLLVTTTWNQNYILLTISGYQETDNHVFEGEEVSVVNIGADEYAVTNSVKVEKKAGRTFFTGIYTSPESGKTYNVEISTRVKSDDEGVLFEPFEFSNLTITPAEDYNLLTASDEEVGMTIALAVDQEGTILKANSTIKLNDEELTIVSGTVSQVYNEDLAIDTHVARVVVFIAAGKVGLELTMYNVTSDLENTLPTTIKANKIIKNGQLIITHDGVEYNAQGQIID